MMPRDRDDSAPTSESQLPLNGAGSFQERLALKEPDLRSSERKVAAFIADRTQEVARLSITELARRSKTSEATVNRLSRSLGYAGYRDMKLDLVRNAVSGTIRNIPRDIKVGDDLPAVAQKLADSLDRAVSGTLRTISITEVARAVESIVKAEHIYFYGIGGSGYVSEIAHHLFLKAGIINTAYGDGYMQAVSSALVTSRDLVVGISHSGATRDVITALKAAHDHGATTIAITGNPNARILDYADIRLVTVSHEEPIYGDFMEAKVCQLFVIDLLYIGALLKDVPVFTRQLEATARAIWDRSVERNSLPQ